MELENAGYGTRSGAPETHVTHCTAIEGLEWHGLPPGPRLVTECERGGVWLGVRALDGVEDRLGKLLPRRLWLHSDAGSSRRRADPEQLRRSAVVGGGEGEAYHGVCFGETLIERWINNHLNYIHTSATICHVTQTRITAV